jgi:hypothetical protein
MVLQQNHPHALNLFDRLVIFGWAIALVRALKND